MWSFQTRCQEYSKNNFLARAKDLAPNMVVVKDANDTIGLLTKCEWMEATGRMEKAVIKAVTQSIKEAE